ncbi:hypothetical protein AGRA3207_005441 [Actinomadura graeca]|uniref:Uncharacterized protein n=1 Tax=Actinomadura graeca TaxID=2750812 RepID=A0ABX8QZB9_9ACTN|nr:hypothetical protein [Actinomadura graeca]QXJ24171.1 hypothetical protein AGRA3207_005441 [Actinomadura graeca]
MTTVILVLLCLAIAGRELYLSSDKRLPRALAELRELRTQVADLSKRHETLRAEVDAAGEPPGIAIPHPSDDDVSGRVEQVAARMERLEKEVGEIGAGLAGLDLERDAQRALARSMDAVEQDINELHREMLDRLDREEGVVTGLVLSEEGEAEALLAEAYERCATEYGLRIRIRDQRSGKAANGAYRGTVYHLSGRRPGPLAEELFSYARGLYDPQDPSGMSALLTELAHLRGGGVARFGPFTAVRTTSALVCGLLPDTDERVAPSEPWELAGYIRELPDDLQCDLSWLRPEN